MFGILVRDPNAVYDWDLGEYKDTGCRRLLYETFENYSRAWDFRIGYLKAHPNSECDIIPLNFKSLREELKGD